MVSSFLAGKNVWVFWEYRASKYLPLVTLRPRNDLGNCDQLACWFPLHPVVIEKDLISGYSYLQPICCFIGTTAPRRRVTPRPTFLQTPQRIHYFVTRNQPVNLTWVATNVCKMQIKCKDKKFAEGASRVCGGTCRKCRTRKKTKIITASDFPEDSRSMTCQCKVWGTIPVRTEKIIVEKACEYLYDMNLMFKILVQGFSLGYIHLTLE